MSILGSTGFFESVVRYCCLCMVVFYNLVIYLRGGVYMKYELVHIQFSDLFLGGYVNFTVSPCILYHKVLFVPTYALVFK